MSEIQEVEYLDEFEDEIEVHLRPEEAINKKKRKYFQNYPKENIELALAEISRGLTVLIHLKKCFSKVSNF